MKLLILFAASTMLTVGHYFKTLRWQQFVAVYEDCGRRRLIDALAVGYLVNFFVPFHLGDLLRTWMAGKGMKNGFGLSLATVLVDRFLDVLTIGVIFMALAAFSPFAVLRASAIFYAAALGVLLVAVGLALVFRDKLKRLILWFCGIFNPRLERYLLLFFWALISASKDMLRRLKKRLLAFNTVMMWGCYFCSYALFSGLLGQHFSEILLMLFGRSALGGSSFFAVAGTTVTTDAFFYSCVYLLLPLAELLLLGALKFKKTPQPARQGEILALIPQAEQTEQLEFLRRYFGGSIQKYINDYIAMNRDLTILRDLSAGSAATTMLCLRGGAMFYRKYAFGDDGKKLCQQARWIEAHKSILPLPDIFSETTRDNSYCYDMTFRTGSQNFFEYIHCHSTDESWQVLSGILSVLRNRLYTQSRPAQADAIRAYIDGKVTPRLREILAASELGSLTQGDNITINGGQYRNLPALLDMFDPGHLTDVFKDDVETEIHGDLTIENLVVDKDAPEGFYFIDPNTGNLLDSPGLDYAKLLQSLHGKYEFLRMISQYSTRPGEVEFLFSYTSSYSALYRRYDEWLCRTFTPRQVRSIYYHELVHWLRLMPYQLKKAGKRAAVYYAAFIVVLNDVSGRFGEMK